MLTQEALKERLQYNPETGVFVWNAGYILAGQEAGWKEPHGYRRMSFGRKKYYAHRLAHLYMNGAFPKDEVDHQNQDRGDNRWSNISETVTRQENKRNNSLRSDNKSGFNGVGWVERTQKWEAFITVGKRKVLGQFKTFEEAVEVRQHANIKYGYHSNHGVKLSNYQEYS